MADEETAKEFIGRLKSLVGTNVKHKGGSGGVFEFSPRGTETEFWSYGNAVSYTCCVIEIIRLIEPGFDPGRANTFPGGRDEPRTIAEALSEMTDPDPSLSTEAKKLITHPHDGHAPNETCLECTSEPKGSDDE